MKKYFVSIASAIVFVLMMGNISTGLAAEPAAGAAISGATGGTVQVAPGFYWVKVQQVYRALGDNKTWVYIPSGAPAGWWWCNDNECEKVLIAAAASAHWLGINFNTTNTFDHVRLWFN
jgi:hypothetical protein